MQVAREVFTSDDLGETWQPVGIREKWLNNILVYVLLGAGFVKLMVGLWLDAAVILGVVIINALLGFFQEGKAEKALDSIRNMLSADARTIRGRESRLISAEEVQS